MSATDILRRMLDERGVEWWQKKRHTCWKVSKGQEVEMWRAWEAPDGSLTLKVDYIYDLTPEQAIAATLGAGTCHDKNGFDVTLGFECTVCGAMTDGYMLSPADTGHYKQFNFCPMCGRRIEQ